EVLRDRDVTGIASLSRSAMNSGPGRQCRTSDRVAAHCHPWCGPPRAVVAALNKVDYNKAEKRQRHQARAHRRQHVAVSGQGCAEEYAKIARIIEPITGHRTGLGGRGHITGEVEA